MRTLPFHFRGGSRLLVLLAVLSLSSYNAAAIPVGEYRGRLEIAIANLETLISPDGHESDADYESRLSGMIDEVRAALPNTQPVESENGRWTTDNTWLHTALDELLRAPGEERQTKLASVLQSLRALTDRVKALESATRVDDDKTASKHKIEGILARPEYDSASRGPNALTKLLRDLARWIESWLPQASAMEPGRATLVSNVIMIAVVVFAVLMILYVAWLLFKRFKRPPKPKVRKKSEARIVLGERLQPDETAADLLSEAEALARSGDLRAAIRKGYIALLVELGDRNLISLAQYKTNRDYLRSVTNVPRLHSPLKRLTESFERHWYGFAQATPADWQDFRARYREALQTGS